MPAIDVWPGKDALWTATSTFHLAGGGRTDRPHAVRIAYMETIGYSPAKAGGAGGLRTMASICFWTPGSPSTVKGGAKLAVYAVLFLGGVSPGNW